MDQTTETTAVGAIPTIVVVDDEEHLRDSLTEYLSTCGLRAIGKDSGLSLRDFLSEQDVDVIVLDINMPGENGLSLAGWLAKTHPHVGIIFSTAADAPSTRTLGIETGGDDFLVKPYNPRELLARIRNLLKRLPGKIARRPQTACATGSGPQIVIGDVRFDVASHRLTGPGRSSTILTHHQAELLHALATRPNRVLSRSYLGSLLPGGDGETWREIDVHVSRLRDRLREAGVAPCPIRTVRGEGYMFET
jgi:two-component system phosphate regulon response regulator OmpR